MTIALSPRLEDLFHTLTGNASPAALADDVLQLSNFYIDHHGAQTPWRESFALRAYGAYFLPLNVARLQAVWQEVRRFIPENAVREIWDFGSGLGAVHWMLEEQDHMSPRTFYCLERETRAVEQHRHLMANSRCHWQPNFHQPKSPSPNALAVFSYSFLEMQDHLPPLENFTHILILEPSFKDTSRTLMKWRDRWIQAGFTPLAPCTHSLACPLLTHSERDWCHQRVHFQAGARFRALESHLPMKNHTLTYSYLLLSQGLSQPGWRGATRVIGDTLPERGKTKQMICRGPDREFLSWLERHGEAPRIPHGALISDLGQPEIKGNEVRVQHQLHWAD